MSQEPEYEQLDSFSHSGGFLAVLAWTIVTWGLYFPFWLDRHSRRLPPDCGPAKTVRVIAAAVAILIAGNLLAAIISGLASVNIVNATFGHAAQLVQGAVPYSLAPILAFTGSEIATDLNRRCGLGENGNPEALSVVLAFLLHIFYLQIAIKYRIADTHHHAA